ncbi:hypothetical protein LguiB_006403 [Lonicera macranthoides]
MPERDVVAWTAMIAGYSSCSHHSSAWRVFYGMMRECKDHPNAFTLSSVLKACKGMKSLCCGALVHGLALKHGVDGSIYVDNALLDMYATCCVSMEDACLVFQDICFKNDVSWTTLITGFTHRGDGYGGLRVFRQMLLDEAEPNPFSFSIAVRACASIGSYTYGQQIHGAIIKYGFDSSIPVMNSILDMYCRCSCLCEARHCFHIMTQRDLITWNTLIAGYEKTDPNVSLCIFSQMELQGFCPNCYTFTSVIAACSNLAVLGCGQQVHCIILQRGLEGDLALGNALIDMYAKCGSILDSSRYFGEMCGRNLVSWTSMMIGYGTHGYGKEAVELFDEMVISGIKPDRIVFMAVLSACSHAGLVDEGLSYFKSMTADYKITPDQEIYGCVVDLLGRGGRVKEAYDLIESMPFKPDESVWGAFLGACKAHGLPLGKKAARRKPFMFSKNPGIGILLALAVIEAFGRKWGAFLEVRRWPEKMWTEGPKAIRSDIEILTKLYNLTGADVEISSDDDGFRGAWYAGTIIRPAKPKNKFLIQYKTLTTDDDDEKPLEETLDLVQLRPQPPRERPRSFEFSQEVDAYHNEGWWEGVITKVMKNERYSVFFRATREQIDFDGKDLRVHREWVNGDWVPPFDDDEV